MKEAVRPNADAASIDCLLASLRAAAMWRSVSLIVRDKIPTRGRTPAMLADFMIPPKFLSTRRASSLPRNLAGW
jgi:hypothetical protein